MTSGRGVAGHAKRPRAWRDVVGIDAGHPWPAPCGQPAAVLIRSGRISRTLRGCASVTSPPDTQNAPCGNAGNESWIGRDRRGPSLARALRAACGCPDSLRANQSNPAMVRLRHVSARHAKRLRAWRDVVGIDAGHPWPAPCGQPAAVLIRSGRISRTLRGCAPVTSPPGTQNAPCGASACLEEREGFEPSVGYKPTPDFESGTFNRSATSPEVGRESYGAGRGRARLYTVCPRNRMV